MKRLAFVILLFLAATACSKPAPLTSEQLAQSDLIITDIKAAPVEYQLAYLDSGRLPRGTDTNAARIRYLLKELSVKTGNAPQQIADRTSQSTGVLKSNYGREVSHQRFLEEASDYFKAGGPKTDYENLSTLLILTMSR